MYFIIPLSSPTDAMLLKNLMQTKCVGPSWIDMNLSKKFSGPIHVNNSLRVCNSDDLPKNISHQNYQGHEKWYDKILIHRGKSGQTGKYLAFAGQLIKECQGHS